jgi:hypothetical protein
MRPATGALILILGFLLVPVLVFSGIGENFLAAGTALSGGLNVSFNLGRVFDVDNEFYNLAVELNPAFLFFLHDNIALSAAPLLQFERNHLNNDNISNSLRLGLGGGLAYYAVRNPRADTGLVPAVGLSLGIAVIPGLDYTFLGSKVTNKALSIPLFLELPFKLLYFIKPRVAPELSVVSRLFAPLFSKDESGRVIDTPFLERVSLETSFYLGVTWFFPPRDVVLLEKE